MRRDWVGFLSADLERRDNRHAFLWALLISLLLGAIYIGSRLYWQHANVFIALIWKDPSLSVGALAALALGAICFRTFGAPFLMRLVGTAQPSSLHHEYSLRQGKLLYRFLRSYGLPLSTYWNNLARLLAEVIVTSAFVTLAVLLQDSWALLLLVVAVVSFLLLSAAILMMLLATGRFFALYELWSHEAVQEYAETGKIDSVELGVVERARLDKSLHARITAALISAGHGKLRASFLANVSISQYRTIRKSKFEEKAKRNKLRIVTVLQLTSNLILASLLLFIMQRATRVSGGYDLPVLAAFLELSALVVLVLAIVQLGARLYVDGTRALLEQLRFAAFKGLLSEGAVGEAFAAIETLTKEGYYPRVALADLLDACDIPVEAISPPAGVSDPTAAIRFLHGEGAFDEVFEGSAT